MAKHDPFCYQFVEHAGMPSDCFCDLIASVQAAERERNTPLDIEAYRVALTRNLRDQIANDIDALHSEYDPSGSGERRHACMDQREHGLLERCAAIARNEVGNDEQTS